jgi:hypothetical protein
MVIADKDLTNRVVKDTPPLEGKMRFGNTAFRNFCQKIYPINKSFALSLLSKINIEGFKNSLKKLEEEGKSLGFSSNEVEEVITEELKTYLDECYGNEVFYFIKRRLIDF